MPHYFQLEAHQLDHGLLDGENASTRCIKNWAGVLWPLWASHLCLLSWLFPIKLFYKLVSAVVSKAVDCFVLTLKGSMP